MSRRALLVALLAAGSTFPAAAQGREALAREVDRLVRRIDSLHARQGESSLLLVAAASGVPAARIEADLDPIAVGGLRILANRSPLPVEAGAREAWSVLEGYFGNELARLPLRAVTIEGFDPDSTHGELGDLADLTLAWDRSAHDVAMALLRKVVPDPEDPALVGWLQGAPAPATSLAPALAAVRPQLLLSPFSSGRACIAGATAACRAALDLLPAAEWTAAAFPLPSDRREVARAVLRTGPGGAQRDEVDRCVSADDAAACTALVGSLEPRMLPRVTPSATRRTLLAVALERGGPDAYHRLRAASTAPMGDRLAAAAGVPIDTLLAEWLRAVEAADRAATPWSARVGFGGIVWIGLLLVASLWSSRWRGD